MSPKVSVVIPVYNREATIRRAIDSVLSQTYHPLEIIVVDDGSTDNTSSILAGYGERIIVIRQNNQGVSSARNRGIQEAQGDFIAFLDSDDEWLPDKIKCQLHVFKEHPNAGLVSTGMQCVDEDGILQYISSITLSGNILETLLYRNAIVTSSVMVKKECLRCINPLFCTEFRLSEDWQLWIRFAARYECIVIPTVLVRYYLTKQSAIRSSPVDAFRSNTQAIYTSLLQDPLLADTVKQKWISLSANVYLHSAYRFYEQDKIQQARKEILKYILLFSPLKVKWSTVIPLLLLLPQQRDQLKLWVNRSILLYPKAMINQKLHEKW